MKNKFLVICMILTMLVTTSCSSSFSSPEETISNLCKNIQNGDLEKASTSFDDIGDIKEDFTELSKETHLFNSSISKYIENNNKQMTYEIINSTEDETGVNILVKFIYIDSTDVVNKSLDLYLDEIIAMLSPNTELTTEQSIEIFNKNFDSVVSSTEPTFTETEINFHINETDGHFLIDSYDPNFFNVISNNFFSAYIAYS